jgi:hypothetical protein
MGDGGSTPMTERAPSRFRDRVRDVVVVASSSRSGSSLFAEWLRRSDAGLLHLRGEPNPLLRSVGLMTGDSGHDGPSDVLTSDDVPADGRLDELLARDVGRPAPVTTPLDEVELAADWYRRLGMEWPGERFDPDEVAVWVRSTLRDVAYVPGEALDIDSFALRFIERVAARHPRVSPYRYDLPAALVRRRAPELEVPDGPPGDRLIEEPPFILVVPWTRARAEELGELPLVLKTPSAGYQLGFYRALFGPARVRVIHLVRNPAASINGLLDGWAHHEFFSRCLPGRLAIRGYTDVHPAWARSWWKFDLPPGWEEVAHATVGEVCAFQWVAAHRSILQSLDALGLESIRIRFEDFVGPDERARSARERVSTWLGAAASEQHGELPRVMSTCAPRPFRWRERASELRPLLAMESVRSMADELGYGGDDADWR